MFLGLENCPGQLSKMGRLYHSGTTDLLGEFTLFMCRFSYNNVGLEYSRCGRLQSTD